MPWLVAGAAAIGGGVANYLSAGEQADAAKKAEKNKNALIREQMANQESSANKAANEIGVGANLGINATNAGYDAANQTLASSYEQAQNAYLGAGAAARQDLASGYDNSLGSLVNAQGQATGAMGAGYQGARDDLSKVAGLRDYAGQAANSINPYDITNRHSRMDTLGQDFQADPGYQFRQQQGEQAINRSAAAQGGRLGGATLKALAGYNQNLASQEYGNFANRQMQADQMDLSALMNQAGRTDSAALAAQNNQMGLAGLGINATGQMAGMQNAYGNSLADLYSQSGKQMADMQQQQGQGQAGLDMSIGTTLYGGQNALGSQLAGNSIGQGASLANLYYQKGVNQANAFTGGAAGAGQLSQSMNYGGNVPYAGGGYTAMGNAFNGAVQNGLAAYQYFNQNQDDNKGGGQ